MKKHISVILTIVVVLALFSGCQFYGNRIVGQGKRPTNFLGTIWVSKDPDIWFEVIGEQNGSRELKGYINKNGVLHDINLGINGGGMIIIGPPESGLTGQCEFYTHKLVIEVDKESDTLFNGAYDTIVFERQEEVTQETVLLAKPKP